MVTIVPVPVAGVSDRIDELICLLLALHRLLGFCHFVLAMENRNRTRDGWLAVTYKFKPGNFSGTDRALSL
jgi:hypothetical protein